MWGAGQRSGVKEEAKKCLQKDGNRPKGSRRDPEGGQLAVKALGRGSQELRGGMFEIMFSVVCWAVR